MCGIVAFTGRIPAAPLLLRGLRRLEYRGYDSAGVAIVHNGMQVLKRAGRVESIKEATFLQGNAGIGHTRWATHGAPCAKNAHPHVFEGVAIVHNGIIENAHELRKECLSRGEPFLSDTDSEVIAHLIARAWKGNLLEAVKNGTRRLKGSYAIAVLRAGSGEIVCARMRSPLVVGRGKEGSFAASDLAAIAEEGLHAYALEDGEFARLTEDSVQLFSASGEEIEREEQEVDPVGEIPDKKGYRHFMRKEIAEIPEILSASMQEITPESQYSDLYRVLCQTKYIEIAACGTAYHSGLCAQYAIEALCRIPVRVSVASEFRYRDPILPEGTLFIAVSQSGETADTLAAAKLAKERGAYVLAVTNVPASSLTRIAGTTLFTRAGKEVAVAATKSFNAQLITLYSLARTLASIRQLASPSLDDFPELCGIALARSELVRSWTPYFAGAKSAYFIGRGADYCVALEGSLKLKEISYLPSEGYAAGELKHGTLAMIEAHTPLVAILTCRELAEKTMNAVHEAYARGASVFLITSFEEYCKRKEVLSSILLPACEAVYSPVLTSIPLQMLAYFVALARGNDPDKPRNLAKSVTVE